MLVPHVSVCVCTYKRPAMLLRLLKALAVQRGDGFTFGVVVADNDAARSAEPVTKDFSQQSSLAITYCHEPRQNIALARNKALANAHGSFIAFIDDDEFPPDNWLLEMLAGCEKFQASGVLAPVRPHFENPPPAWIIKGRFCERPEPPTGTKLEWANCRTGNVVFRREIIAGEEEPFHPQFGTGGEDVDFFRRMAERGCTFFWCNEGAVYETVPPERWTRKYMLRRAMLRGRNGLKLRAGRGKRLLTSMVAVPLYGILLPFTLLAGQHVFMRYCIPFCDHLGRLLALIGINPVHER